MHNRLPLAMTFAGLIPISLGALPSQAFAQQSTAVSPTASISGTHQENGFTIFDYVHVPSNAIRKVVNGIHVGNGCGFHGSATLRPGQAPVIEDEIGLNPATCQEIVAKYSGPTGTTGQANSHLRARSKPAFQRMLVQNTSAHLYSYWTDPAAIKVTEVKSRLWWSYNYSCVSNVTGGYTHGWYSASSWEYVGPTSPYTTVTCNTAEQDVADHFKNKWFCAGFVSYSDYYYNRVDGHQDGTVDANWYSTVSGGAFGCLNALTQHHELAYGA